MLDATQCGALNWGRLWIVGVYLYYPTEAVDFICVRRICQVESWIKLVPFIAKSAGIDAVASLLRTCFPSF